MLPYVVTMGCATEGLWFNCQQGKRYFSTPEDPEEFWGPPILFCSGYMYFFPWEYSGQIVKLAAHLHLMMRLRMSGAMPPWCSEGLLYPVFYLWNTLSSTFVFSLDCWDRMTSGSNTLCPFQA